jgi:hypothetical protein
MVGTYARNGRNLTIKYEDSSASIRLDPDRVEFDLSGVGSFDDSVHLDVSIGETLASNFRPSKVSLTRPILIPDIIVRRLKNTEIDALNRFQAIVVSRAFQCGFPIQNLSVDLEKDPEEEITRAVLRVYTTATPTQTFAFWESLGSDFEELIAIARPLLRRVIEETVSLRFHWATVR